MNRPVTPAPRVGPLLAGHERREQSACWRPRGTPTALLVHTRAGHGTVRTDAGADRVIGPGDTILWGAGACQDFANVNDREPWEIIWAHFTPRPHWQEWFDWPRLGPKTYLLSSPPAPALTRIVDALLEMHASAHSASHRAPEFAFNALERALLWLGASHPGPHQLDPRVHEAILMITRLLDTPLDTTSLAAAVHLSPSRLTHLFTAQLGMPPGRFIERRRIEHAQSLLDATAMPVGRIARAAGFKNQFYFATRFRVHTGITPTQWRSASSADEPA
jgi:AraC family transcriptional regulator of arabinose operon